MIHLQPIIDRIKALLEEDTDASVTYAALEARLALEKVCYDRLRQRHDYISHDELRKWQPGDIINRLISDVDAHATETMTLRIGKSDPESGVKPEDDEYVEVGTQAGFDAKKIVKMWNAVAGLALHVRLPKNKDDHIPDYGDKAKIRAKVQDIVTELERLAKGTMVFSGIGMEISFECACGTKNRRREKLLRDGQHIFCINPDCLYSWKVVKEGGEFGFERVTVDINCARCDGDIFIPWRFVAAMKYDTLGKVTCASCGHENLVKWELMRSQSPPSGEDSDQSAPSS